jgi:hypothetical protein
MGYIDENGVYVYDEADLFAPVHTALNLGQTSISEALGDLTDKVDALDPTLPLVYSKGMPGSTATAITATSWANIAGTNLSITLPKKAVVEVSTNAWLQIASFSSGSVELRAGVAVSGATTVAPNTAIPGMDNGWGGVLWLATGATGGRAQGSSTRLMTLNAGTNTFNLQAYRSAATVSMSVSYGYYIVKILKWTD